MTSQEGHSSYHDSYFRIAREDLLHHKVEKDLEEDDGPGESRTQIPREVEFLWDTDNEQPPRGTPSSAHRAAIELLRHAHEEQVDVSRFQGRTLRDMRHLLEGWSMELDAFQRKMGRINDLANQHGLVAEAIEKALAGEEAIDLTALSDNRGSGPKNVIFLYGPNFLSECSKLLH